MKVSNCVCWFLTKQSNIISFVHTPIYIFVADLVKGSAGGMSIYDLVTSGINYLDTRQVKICIKKILRNVLKIAYFLHCVTGFAFCFRRSIIFSNSKLVFRTEFWRQQKPMYARKRDRMLMQQKWAHKATRIDDPTAYILKNLEDIDQCRCHFFT